MPTKEEDFKQRLAAVLSDLNDEGKNDAEAMWLLGSLAAGIVDKAGAASWPAFKRDISRDTYDRLLGDFQAEGNRQYADGDEKKAYAIQALGLSLVARTQQRDPTMAQGEQLLDAIVTSAIAFFRKNKVAPN